MRIFKRKDFARWRRLKSCLARGGSGYGSGLIDADLGGALHKKRVAHPCGGKSGGYRMLLSDRIDSRYVFLHGFPKSDKANIMQDERKALQFACKVFLESFTEALSKAMPVGVLFEVHCE